MSKGKETLYAPKALKSQRPKPSFQPIKVSVYAYTIEPHDTVAPPPDNPTEWKITSQSGDLTAAHTWAGSLLNAPGFDTVSISDAIYNVPGDFTVIGVPTGIPRSLSPISAEVYVFADGFAFSDVSWWTCQQCGLPWRKFELRRHQFTGKFVCPQDYDELSQDQLTSENNYKAGAMEHAADLYVALGEFP